MPILQCALHLQLEFLLHAEAAPQAARAEPGDAENAESVAYHWEFIQNYKDRGQDYAIAHWLLPGILYDLPVSADQWESHFTEVARTESVFRSDSGLAALRDCATQWRENGARKLAAQVETFRSLLERYRSGNGPPTENGNSLTAAESQDFSSENSRASRAQPRPTAETDATERSDDGGTAETATDPFSPEQLLTATGRLMAGEPEEAARNLLSDIEDGPDMHRRLEILEQLLAATDTATVVEIIRSHPWTCTLPAVHAVLALARRFPEGGREQLVANGIALTLNWLFELEQRRLLRPPAPLQAAYRQWSALDQGQIQKMDESHLRDLIRTGEQMMETPGFPGSPMLLQRDVSRITGEACMRLGDMVQELHWFKSATSYIDEALQHCPATSPDYYRCLLYGGLSMMRQHELRSHPNISSRYCAAMSFVFKARRRTHSRGQGGTYQAARARCRASGRSGTDAGQCQGEHEHERQPPRHGIIHLIHLIIQIGDS